MSGNRSLLTSIFVILVPNAAPLVSYDHCVLIPRTTMKLPVHGGPVMSRGIDHLVLCVQDLKKAADVYQRMGFTMTPQAQHPFGTGNILAQLDGWFLEVLSVTEPENIPKHDGEHFSFGAFNRDYLKSREGISMLVLDSTDETQDRAEYQSKGLHVFEPFEFKRLAKQPDGRSETVGFSLTFVDDPALPDMAFFTCKQWRPDLFWKPDYQRHANGGLSIAETYVVTNTPEDAGKFLSAYADASPQTEADGTIRVTTSRGDLVAMPPAAFAKMFPGAIADDENRTAYFAGFKLQVSDLDATRACWAGNNINFVDNSDGIWIKPEYGFGCVIAAVT
jgi:hypothetical protein